MFTGIIEEVGAVRGVVSGSAWGSITVGAKRVLEGTKRGDSIAVNGVCLTVTNLFPDGFTADVMAETLRRSNLGALRAGDRVNLERALAADGRFGGHIVSGHVDGLGEITEIRREGNAHWVTLAAPPALLELVVEKGSIAMDGVSLTVAARTEGTFSVSLIPTTAADTTLLQKGVGAKINLETDIVGKYVRQLLRVPAQAAARDAESRISEAFLKQYGF